MARKMFVADSGGGIHSVEVIHFKDVDGAVRTAIAGWVARSSGDPQQFWPPEGADPGTYTYHATWANSYGDGQINDSSHRDELNYQGESSWHGDESSLWGFDYAQIQSDLAGLAIQ
jgi:hypothetical protein